ncbi:serine hydrolase domain-containing protein [Chitinophaga tropicalis]|uniref:Serine hydrolase n=1 Tax=Chitinophaga tropicalis TaxID=2683588 RepID=A0A7K1U2U7_9BACT|nr:serine hydrolase domain-containing protein [Chitinophaga tropicalis]MVT08694.1 serine hydrolase [Chitinophaga tropicalis]
MCKPLFPLLIAVITLTAAYGQKREEPLETRIDLLVENQLPSIAPGSVVLIAKRGEIIYRKAFGKTNQLLNVPMQPEMLFRIGAITQQFTAVAVLQLVEQGRIHLQDSIQQYIKDFPVKDHTITIEHLLSQTSGIRSFYEFSNPAKEKPVYKPAELVEYFRDEPLEFKPGTKFNYSVSNYCLLGYIIEQVTGMSYADYIQQQILDKASLTNTHYIDPEKIVPNKAGPYSRFNKRLQNAVLEDVTTLYAAGGLLSNADDLFKWHQALYAGTLLKQDALYKAFTPYILADGATSTYGYGWYLKALKDSWTIESSGSTDGYQCDMLYVPEEDLFIATMFNCYEQDMDWEVLTNDIARAVIGKPSENLNLTEDELQKYVGVYEYDKENQIVINMEYGELFVRATNPDAHLPRAKLYLETREKLYIKEAPLKLVIYKQDERTKLVTYKNRRKDLEWIKVR